MLRRSLVYLSQNEWLQDRLPRYRFAQKAVRRFMPGETLEDAVGACQSFGSNGISNILTYLGENVQDPAEAREMAQEYVDALHRVAATELDCEVSVKLSQLGLYLDEGEVYQNLREITETAQRHGNFMWIDMESSSDTDVTLQLFTRLRKEFPNVGVCLQASLYRTPDDLEVLLPLHPAIRLVKGAYAEPANLAYPKKADVDEAFFRLAKVLLEDRKENGETRPAFATHDRVLVDRILEVAEELELPRDGFEFQMLYGIERKYQEQLSERGYSVRVLISYGNAWFPWFMRRLAERPANLGFMVKHAFG